MGKGGLAWKSSYFVPDTEVNNLFIAYHLMPVAILWGEYYSLLAIEEEAEAQFGLVTCPSFATISQG